MSRKNVGPYEIWDVSERKAWKHPDIPYAGSTQKKQKKIKK
jgi:hypothetical protein